MKQPLPDPQARAASKSSGHMPKGGFAALVPELDVSDLDASLSFWVELLGFEIAYDRPAARFVYLERDSAQIMLCQINGRWVTGQLETPFGRGINFQIAVDRLDPILARLKAAGVSLFEAPSEAWYRVGEQESGVRECLVQDPDGYLIRLSESLGMRAKTG